jgi:hypothetical protein
VVILAAAERARIIGSDAATRQEDGEPGWRFKIRRPLLMALARFGKAA